ncbi:MAG TPA: hypothetical protein VEB64_04430 [Azospirillaceae bacterium]|nr:hypothetical protein [Azospirillaceae bacterium]
MNDTPHWAQATLEQVRIARRTLEMLTLVNVAALAFTLAMLGWSLHTGSF